MNELEPSGAGGFGLGLGLGAGKLLERAFGPMADSVGKGLGELSDVVIARIRRILESAVRKLGHDADPNAGVPLRVAEAVIRDGAVRDDEVAADSLGGVLASARSGIDRDDRGVSMLALIRSMSVYELRAHYIVYSVLRRTYYGIPSRDGESPRHLLSSPVWISARAFARAMDFSDDEAPMVILEHVSAGLRRHTLIDDLKLEERAGSVRDSRKAAELGPVVLAGGEDLGAELFLWAHNLASVMPSQFFSADFTVEPWETVLLPGPDDYVGLPQS